MLATLVVLGGCRERSASNSREMLDAAGLLIDPCAGNSLRPGAGAPAQGVWLSESASGGRVLVRIGPARSDDNLLVVTRPVESLEVGASGDTIRARLDAATVALEPVPPLGSLGTAGSNPDSSAGSARAATYRVTGFVRLAAYESCPISDRGSRVRYLRRDRAGQIVTDVMLHRVAEQ